MSRTRTTFRPAVEALEDRWTPTTLPPGFRETIVTGGLSSPTAMEFAPDGRLFIAEQGGALRVVTAGGTLLPTPFVTLSVNAAGERGLLGIAFDPNFAVNQFVYVYYTTATAPIHNRVSRFTASGNVAVPGSEVVLMDLEPLSSATNHNGGAIHFGADGKLYIAVGENANPANAQSLGNRLGKMLRINPDGSIPSDNPFVGVPGANPVIWALGLRNPFTFAVQPGTGRIFINDVGAAVAEEVNEGKAGGNYGWPTTEGFFDPAAFPGFLNPLFAYGHGAGNQLGCAISGGAFYNPAAGQFPSGFVGDYFFADFCNRWIRRLDLDGGNAVTDFAADLEPGLVDLKVGADGALYYLARGTGAATGVLVRIDFPASQTGPVYAIGAGAGGGPDVRVFHAASSVERFRFFAYDAGFRGGVRVAAGDVTGDGVPDVVTGAGPGGGPDVRVISGKDGADLLRFFAFPVGFTGGVFVAAGDLDGDSFADVFAGAGAGGGPDVHLVSGRTGRTLARFFAYPVGFTGGVTVGATDVTDDGRDELILGAGPGGGPDVRILDGAALADLRRFFAFPAGFTGGIFVGGSRRRR
jgi:glucose/arabinose dehydrogenase